MTTNAITFHPLATIFPRLDDQAFAELVADIKQHGVREPIWIHDGKILDGRNRWLASREAHRKCPSRVYTGKDPLAFVLSANLRRRHLTESHRAMIAEKIATMRQGERTDLEPSLNLEKVSVGTAAKMLNVSPAAIAQARKVRRDAVAEVVQAVESGQLAVSTAAALADQAAEFQKAVMAKVAGGTKCTEAARDLRRQEMVPQELPQGVFDVVLADPPWRYEFSTEKRAVERHYPTMTVEEICALRPPFADNGVLFLWATAPMMREALQVLDAWGFEYKTNSVWVKDHIGMGFWFRGQHEHLLVATRGQWSPPPAEARVSSLIVAPRRKHSQKPAIVHELIERMFPSCSNRLELFAREERKGWVSWGNEPRT